MWRWTSRYDVPKEGIGDEARNEGWDHIMDGPELILCYVTGDTRGFQHHLKLFFKTNDTLN